MRTTRQVVLKLRRALRSRGRSLKLLRRRLWSGRALLGRLLACGARGILLLQEVRPELLDVLCQLLLVDVGRRRSCSLSVLRLCLLDEGRIRRLLLALRLWGAVCLLLSLTVGIVRPLLECGWRVSLRNWSGLSCLHILHLHS